MGTLAVAFTVFVFLLVVFILQGLRKIPAEPPHVAVVTIFGKRTPEVKEEGWRFFPIYPFWYGAVLIDITQKNKDLTPQTVRTPELGEIEVVISVTWRPDFEPSFTRNSDGEYLIKYLNAGGKEGVENILDDIVKEKVREFAIHEVKDWEELLRMRGNLVGIIAAEIIGEYWKDFDKNEQREITNSLRTGNGAVRIEGLGIILNRLNITSITPKGRLAATADLEAKERQERKAEIFELEHITDMLDKLSGLGFSSEQALEIVQTERGKVTKDIKELKLSVSQETRNMIDKIGDNIVAKLLEGER